MSDECVNVQLMGVERLNAVLFHLLMGSAEESAPSLALSRPPSFLHSLSGMYRCFLLGMGVLLCTHTHTHTHIGRDRVRERGKGSTFPYAHIHIFLPWTLIFKQCRPAVSSPFSQTLASNLLAPYCLVSSVSSFSRAGEALPQNGTPMGD